MYTTIMDLKFEYNNIYWDQCRRRGHRKSKNYVFTILLLCYNVIIIHNTGSWIKLSMNTRKQKQNNSETNPLSLLTLY